MKRTDEHNHLPGKPSTDVLHKGYVPERSEGAVIPPLFFSSTYEFTSAEEGKKAFQVALTGSREGSLIYQRLNHPTSQILEERVAKLEPGADSAAAFSCGMSAIDTTMSALLPKGKTLVFTNPVYGGSFCLFREVYQHARGYNVLEMNGRDLPASAEILASLGENLGVLFIETPANPTLAFLDMQILAAQAKAANPDCIVMVDNTFMGIFQNPFLVSPDIDVVIYSATKFLGGHSNLLGGFTMVRVGRNDLMLKILSFRTVLGSIMSPFVSQQMMTTVATYKLRMTQQALNATTVAQAIANHPRIDKILFPVLFKEGTTEFDLYSKQCTGPSSIITVYLKDADEAKTFNFIDLLSGRKYFSNAVSLGGVESLVCHPMTTTHSEMTPEEMQRGEISANMIRLSIGLEDPSDLIDDLVFALDEF